MKSMKSLSMNKMLGGIKRKSTGKAQRSTYARLLGHLTKNYTVGSPSSTSTANVPRAGESPEKTAHDSVKAFCESGYNVQGDEVLFLPPIVDAAESSPAAAAECARLIRKFLYKEYFQRAAWQYNAIMLLRILTENPGSMFTRYLDSKFADACKNLLRGTKDLNVRQMLIETLDDFERTKSHDENLSVLLQMWAKEKTKIQAVYGSAPSMAQPRPFLTNPQPPAAPNGAAQTYFSRHHTNNKLPTPVELASRLEEARTSAKLLEQVVMNTPPADTLDNELIKEFADRCLSASRSIQGYMVASNPGPDNETMESLIDTNEQLQTALNQHQRSVLSARKQLGLNVRSEETTPAPGSADEEGVSPVQDSPALPRRHGKGKQTEPYQAEASGSGAGSSSSLAKNSRDKAKHDDGDPFADPFVDPQHELNGASSRSRTPAVYDEIPPEPFHPGFTPAADPPPSQPAYRVPGSNTALGSGPAGASNAQHTRDMSIEDLYEAAATKSKHDS